MSKYLDKSDFLGVLSLAPAQEVKALANEIVPELGPVEVLSNRTSLTALPCTGGAGLDMGEVLVSEAHVLLAHGTEGVGACLGTDQEQALAIAILDAAVETGIAVERIMDFVETQAAILAEADDDLLHDPGAMRATFSPS